MTSPWFLFFKVYRFSADFSRESFKRPEYMEYFILFLGRIFGVSRQKPGFPPFNPLRGGDVTGSRAG
jgi:hypothetical protein